MGNHLQKVAQPRRQGVSELIKQQPCKKPVCKYIRKHNTKQPIGAKVKPVNVKGSETNNQGVRAKQLLQSESHYAENQKSDDILWPTQAAQKVNKTKSKSRRNSNASKAH